MIPKVKNGDLYLLEFYDNSSFSENNVTGSECIVSSSADVDNYVGYKTMVSEVRSNRASIGITEKSDSGITLAAGAYSVESL